MKLDVQFRIGNRWSATSRYSLREFCISIVERYSLTETEVCTIATNQSGEVFQNNDLKIVKK